MEDLAILLLWLISFLVGIGGRVYFLTRKTMEEADIDWQQRAYLETYNSRASADRDHIDHYFSAPTIDPEHALPHQPTGDALFGGFIAYFLWPVLKIFGYLVAFLFSLVLIWNLGACLGFVRRRFRRAVTAAYVRFEPIWHGQTAYELRHAIDNFKTLAWWFGTRLLLLCVLIWILVRASGLTRPVKDIDPPRRSDIPAWVQIAQGRVFPHEGSSSHYGQESVDYDAWIAAAPKREVVRSETFTPPVMETAEQRLSMTTISSATVEKVTAAAYNYSAEIVERGEENRLYCRFCGQYHCCEIRLS